MSGNSMKTLVLGDTHGHNSWKEILEKETFDKVIMLGDYVDSFTLKPKEIADNLLDIIKTKEKLGDKMVLIYGNHDHSYYSNERCSGWKIDGYYMYSPLLEDMMKENMLELIHIQDDIIFSHAGVSDYWMREVCGFNDVSDITFDKILEYPLGLSCLDWNMVKGYNGYGDTISQSPIWIRPKSLLESKVEGYRQVVGHTHFRTPVEEQGVYFNDMMPHHYIVVEGGDIKFIEYKE